jgi:hypothetical protein
MTNLPSHYTIKQLITAPIERKVKKIRKKSPHHQNRKPYKGNSTSSPDSNATILSPPGLPRHHSRSKNAPPRSRRIGSLSIILAAAPPPLARKDGFTPARVLCWEKSQGNYQGCLPRCAPRPFHMPQSAPQPTSVKYSTTSSWRNPSIPLLPGIK